MSEAVLVPVGAIPPNLDNDDPNYRFGGAGLYLNLALAYDALAAPAFKVLDDGTSESDYAAMQPRLAVSWREQENGDWIVSLRPGVRSHAGNELTAEDIAWTFQKSYAHRTLSSWRWREVVGVESVSAIDRYTLRYALRAPYPTFPNWLLSVTPNIVDSQAIMRHATPEDVWGIGWLNRQVSGFGPYELSKFEPNAMTFTGRDDYWMGELSARCVEVQKFDRRAEALSQLDEKRPVVVLGTDPDETLPLLARDDLTIRRTWSGHTSIEIDFTTPPFDDERVRHALAYATPYEELLSTGLLGLARSWRSPLKRASQWYDPSHWRYGEDVGKARALLKSAGHRSGLKCEFYLPQRADSRRMAEIIAKAWARIGVELEFQDVTHCTPGWLPPLYLRMECSHNLSEPIYDLAHDYAAMDPILPCPGGPPHIGNWHPRWNKNGSLIAAYTEMLEERDRARKRRLFDKLQGDIVSFGSSIFIAEIQQTMIANRLVPPGLLSGDSRFFQALQYQNCSTTYLPERPWA